jgi:hypothetical protein
MVRVIDAHRKRRALSAAAHSLAAGLEDQRP